MQRALDKEPQVSITTNLAPQLEPGGLIVPEQIELYLTLMNLASEFSFDSSVPERQRRELGCVAVLNKSGIQCNDITWPALPTENLQPFIRTYIRVFGNVDIGDFRSGLTMPKPICLSDQHDQNWQLQPGQKLHFEYRLEPTPELIAAPSSCPRP